MKNKRIKIIDSLHIDINWIVQECNFLEEHISKKQYHISFCHNDLLPGNLLLRDSDGKIQFIDFEYGQYNYRSFDMANHFVELSGDFQDLAPVTNIEANHFITCYLRFELGREPTLDEIEEIYQETQLFMLLSLLFWGCWSLYQCYYSKIEFDYVRYAIGRFTTYNSRKESYFSQEQN